MKLLKKAAEIVRDNASMTLICKEESTAIKGVLMLLVILGHDKYLMDGTGMLAFKFLYSFHVYAFFLLPFLYNHRRQSLWPTVWKNCKRFGVPYFIAFVALCAIAQYRGVSMNVPSLVGGFLSGELRGVFGLGGALWFIPTMFVLLCVKQLYYQSGTTVRVVLLAIGLMCLFAHAFLYPKMLFLLPTCVLKGLAMLPLGITLRHIVSSHCPYVGKWPNVLFFAVVIAFFIAYSKHCYWEYFTLVRVICPMAILLFLLTQASAFRRINLVRQIGVYSFPIYLVHLFVYQAAYSTIDRLWIPGFWVALCLYGAVALLSLWIAKLKFIKYLFPR